jgi:hypothetical protein
MKEDLNGWGHAPAGTHWTCPECSKSSVIEDWIETETYCEDCGSHDARQCPSCKESFDHVWGSEMISEATEAHQ